MSMMTKCSDDVWEALSSLESNRDFNKLRGWLTDSLADLDRKSRHTSPPSLMWQQGARQALEDILDAASGARETFQKIKDLRRNQA